MASSFVGLPVLIRLVPSSTSPTASDDTCTGVLSSLDPHQGTITLTEARTTTVGGVSRMEGIKVLRREEVRGLELLSVERGGTGAGAVGGGTQTHGQGHGQEDGVRRVQTQQHQPHHPHPHHQQHFLPSPLPSPSPLSGSPKPAGGKKRNRRPKNHSNNRLPWQDGAYDNGGGDEADLSTAYVEEDSYSRRRQHPAQLSHHSQPSAASFDEDFDFGAGLASFDKARVFEQIRETDTIDPSLRLHAHNRNPYQPGRSLTPQQREGQVKLLPTENVLSAQELHEQQQERLAAVAARAGAGGSMGGSRGGSGTGETPTDQSGSASTSAPTSAEASEYEDAAGTGRELSRAHSRLREVALADGGALDEGIKGELVTLKGVRVPTVTGRQWREALSIAEIESSPTAPQRLELSAYALVSYILTLLSPSAPRKAPKILLLCTPCTHGLAALRAGTLLAHRGVKITALIGGADDAATAMAEEWRTSLRVLSASGGRVVRDEVADLAAPSSFNLILDALSDPLSSSSSSSSSSTANPLSASTSSLSLPLSPRPDSSASSASAVAFAAEAVGWANQAPPGVVKLAVEVPYGVDAETAAPLPTLSSPPSIFHPTHILAFALPRPSLPVLLQQSRSRSHSASPSSSTPLQAAALADTGFAPRVWERVGAVDDAGEVGGVFGMEGRGWVEVRVR
ncbi:hypothetical protein JCM6882_004847 [Rhodosporidiobolus microsporus]